MHRETSVDWFASLTLGELVRSLWHYRFSIIVSAFVLTVLMTAGIYFLPAKYDSDAQLLVRLGRGTLSTDPTSSITPTVSVQETRLSQVSSVKEMLESRALAEQVVKRVGVGRILEPHGALERTLQSLTKQLSAFTGGGGGGGGDGGLSPEEARQHVEMEEAIAKLQDNLQLTTSKNAYTI
ncbi:MAG: Wzz/FepE/Etk N-terminal domain-containing protein, partial [Aureliella sp.]